MGRLDGKVAIITGRRARGQGEVETLLFAAQGAKIVLGDILDEGGQTSRSASCRTRRARRSISTWMLRATMTGSAL